MKWIFAAALTAGVSGDPPPPEPESVLRLPPAVIEQLDQKIKRRSPIKDRRLDLLIDFMYSGHGLGLQYLVSPTHDVAGAIEARRANCLSFTLLFLAMAEHVGIEASPREVQVPINWRRNGTSLYESGHVNIYIRTEKRRAVVDFEPNPILSRRLSTTHRARRVDRDRILAHFYNNRAAELLAEGKVELARQWSDVALELAPDFTGALNNRGVIETRIGHSADAEAIFQHVLEVDSDDVNALFNLHVLYRRTGQAQAADETLDRLSNLSSRDPYLHWSMAENLESIGELDRAATLYRRAIRLKNDEPLFHAGLARIAYARGDMNRAERSLATAMQLSNANPTLAFEWDDSLLFLRSRLAEQ